MTSARKRLTTVLRHLKIEFLRQRIDRLYGPHCWRRIDLYYTFYSLRFSDCKGPDNHTYHWCLRRL